MTTMTTTMGEGNEDDGVNDNDMDDTAINDDNDDDSDDDADENDEGSDDDYDDGEVRNATAKANVPSFDNLKNSCEN